METLQRFLLVSAIVLFIIVFYKWLLKYLRRKEVSDPFPYVYPLPEGRLNGSVTVKFDMPYDSQVRAEAIAEVGGAVATVFDQKIEKGSREVEFDLSALPEGEYELKISFPNQTIRRPIFVSHSSNP